MGVAFCLAFSLTFSVGNVAIAAGWEYCWERKIAMNTVGNQIPQGSFSGRTGPHLLALQAIADAGFTQLSAPARPPMLPSVLLELTNMFGLKQGSYVAIKSNPDAVFSEPARIDFIIASAVK
jgi:hypothetical protein